jgi:hypothetical protein
LLPFAAYDLGESGITVAETNCLIGGLFLIAGRNQIPKCMLDPKCGVGEREILRWRVERKPDAALVVYGVLLVERPA